MEDYERSFFVVLRPAYYDDAEEEVEFGEIHLFLSRSYVIAVRHGRASGLGDARRAARGASRPARAGPRRRRLGDPRHGRRRLPAGRRRDRQRHHRGRAGDLRGGRRRDPADLLPEARGDPVPPCDRAAARPARDARARRVPRHGRAAAPLLPRRRRPRAPGRRAGHLAARAADLDPRGQPGAARRAAERGRSAGSRPGRRSSPCRRSSPRSGG